VLLKSAHLLSYFCCSIILALKPGRSYEQLREYVEGRRTDPYDGKAHDSDDGGNADVEVLGVAICVLCWERLLLAFFLRVT
jgi:hypothetical protein